MWSEHVHLMPFYVIKIGGSLLGCAKELMHSLFDLRMEGYSFLVVPGGGVMADLVRDIFSRYHISQEAAHWMAILAMEQYAYFLADGTKAALTAKIKMPSSDGLEILLPYQALLQNDKGLLHNWDYTSDSVAVLAAIRLEAPLIKATNVDGVIINGKVVEEILARDLIDKESCIDRGALILMQGIHKPMNIRILNGTKPHRFVEDLRNEGCGTIIRNG